MAWRAPANSIPESIQKPLRAQFVDLSNRLGRIDGALYNYENQMHMNPRFPQLVIEELSEVKGTMDYLEIAFLNDQDKKEVKTFEASEQESMSRKGRQNIPQIEGRSRDYLKTKRSIVDLYLAVRIRFISLSAVFKARNYFEESYSNLSAEDIPEN